MTESSAVNLPPPEADTEATLLRNALAATGPFPTEHILRSAAEDLGLRHPDLTVPYLAGNIGFIASLDIADAVEAEMCVRSPYRNYPMEQFSALREHEDTGTAGFEFITEDHIDFGFLEFLYEFGSSEAVSTRLSDLVRDNLGTAVLSRLRSSSLTAIDRHYWRRVHYTRTGIRVEGRELRVPDFVALEAVSFLIAAFTNTSAHQFYRDTTVRWIDRINGVWAFYVSETVNCRNCGEDYFSFDGHYIDGEGEEWCGSCREEHAFYCDGCDGTFHVDQMNSGPGDNSVCDSCREQRTWLCDGCGERQWNDENCGNCYDSDYDSSDGSYGPLRVNYYSFKPEPLFFAMRGADLVSDYLAERSPSEDDKIFFGMELETNIRSGGSAREGGEILYNSALVSGLGFIYAKSDCTVSGPELVTHPATLAAHRHLWDQFPFRELTQKRWSGWAGANAGCHIHVDRRAFRNKAHLARFQLYFGSWRDELVNFGGRNCSSYGYHGQSMVGASRAVAYATQRQYPARGSAINYENRATIEVRMFRASLRQATVMAYLEFLHGLIHYSATHGSKHIMSDNGLAFSTFAEWLTNNSNGNYDNAVARITERVSA